MKQFVLLTMLMFTMCIYAQEQTVSDSLKARRERRKVDVGPSFPGGKEVLKRYLELNTHYPEDAMNAGITGSVIIGFFVEPNGNIDNVTVLKSVHPLLDAEAVRVISAMPRWSPGLVDGKPVRVRTRIPVTFGKTSARHDTISTDATTSKDKEDALKTHKQPSFPGGSDALKKYLSENLRYPEDAQKAGIQGNVTICFIVEKDCSISCPEIEKPLHPSLNEEAMRIVKEMPRWEPGMNKGKPISAKYHLPILFQLKSYQTLQKPMSRPGVNRNVFGR
jgi:TonB family protein